MDVLNSDFRCKWPSKNNFSELDISQSLVWQCPSLSPYFLLPYSDRAFFDLLGPGGGGVRSPLCNFKTAYAMATKFAQDSVRVNSNQHRYCGLTMT